jgi:protein-disulfide isomerase
LATHPENLTFIVRHFPLSQHQHGVLAAEAAEAAGDQGKFWEMYDLIYANQANWESVGGAEARSMFVGLAEQLELNLDQFNTALDNHTFRDKILRDVADGNAANVTGTPTFYVDGAKFTGSLQNLVTLIEARIQSAEEGEGAEREESMEPVGEVGLEE